MADIEYGLIQEGNEISAYIKQVVVDNLSDIDGLPVNWAPGSTAVCLEDSSVWMLCVNKEWHEL